MNEDLAKYEAELVALNKRVGELDDAKTNILRQGYRIEGIVAYLRAKKQAELAKLKELEKDAAPAKEEVSPA